jgi:hypothetical protein
MQMTRLMILWENCDLATALEQEKAPFHWGLMLADARLTRHTLHRYNFEAVPTGRAVDAVRLRWETPQRDRRCAAP